jgi:hypothetical protein
VFLEAGPAHQKPALLRTPANQAKWQNTAAANRQRSDFDYMNQLQSSDIGRRQGIIAVGLFRSAMTPTRLPLAHPSMMAMVLIPGMFASMIGLVYPLMDGSSGGKTSMEKQQETIAARSSHSAGTATR